MFSLSWSQSLFFNGLLNKREDERIAVMPLSSGILIGSLTVVIGVAIYAGTRQKKAAMIVIGCGAGMALLTLGVAALAVNSGM